jgi:hypothetical protein
LRICECSGVKTYGSSLGLGVRPDAVASCRYKVHVKIALGLVALRSACSRYSRQQPSTTFESARNQTGIHPIHMPYIDSLCVAICKRPCMRKHLWVPWCTHVISLPQRFKLRRPHSVDLCVLAWCAPGTDHTIGKGARCRCLCTCQSSRLELS